MTKHKIRHREDIIGYLRANPRPVGLRQILQILFSKEELKSKGANLERLVNNELRQLVKDKEIDRLPGSLYKIRPPKTPKQVHEPDSEKTFSRPDTSRGPQAFLARARGDKKIDKEKPARHQVSNAKRSDHRRGQERSTHKEHLPSNEKKGRNPFALVGKVIKNPKGFAFVALEKAPANIKEDIFLNPEEAQDLMTGDRVEIRISPKRSPKGLSGELVRVVERGVQKIIGRYEPAKAGLPPFAEIESKDMHLRVALPKDPAFRSLPEGSAVVVEITSPPRGKEPAYGKILSVLADSLNATTDDPYILNKHKLREDFPLETIREAESFPDQIGPTDYAGREDLRNLPFVTIDGRDARDFDDAVCAKYLDKKTIRLWVAIADVAHYVKPGSPLDLEAYQRGTSTYFPHRVLPMLPERLSNGLCSLNPNEDRLCMVAEIDYDKSGRKIHQRVFEGVFQSQHRCVYEDLQKFYDSPNTEAEKYNPAVRESLGCLFELYKIVRKTRNDRGSIDLDLPEAKVKVGKDGEVESIKRTERLDTHRLIEEFMIAANEAVSEIMIENKLPFVFRVHETPEPDAVKKFLDTAKSMGLSLHVPKEGEMLDPRTYQSWADEIQKSPAARVLHFQLLRSMKQAYYADENLMHFGLASAAYSHFTSPIRRYPDLMVHRLLKAFLHKQKSDIARAQGGVAADLAEACQHCSQRERLSAEAEREIIRMKQVRYAERHLGDKFKGTVVGINNRGAYVELEEMFLEGFIPLDKFGGGFEFVERGMVLRERRSGKQIRLGDQMQVQIVRTNPHLLQIELAPLGEKIGRQGKE